jgi:hypothetical protein
VRRRRRGGVVLMSGSGNALSGVVMTFMCQQQSSEVVGFLNLATYWDTLIVELVAPDVDVPGANVPEFAIAEESDVDEADGDEVGVVEPRALVPRAEDAGAEEGDTEANPEDMDAVEVRLVLADDAIPEDFAAMEVKLVLEDGYPLLGACVLLDKLYATVDELYLWVELTNEVVEAVTVI